MKEPAFDLADYFDHPRYDEAVEQAVLRAETDLERFAILGEAAAGYVLRREYDQAEAHSRRARALLPSLTGADLPPTPRESTIKIGEHGVESYTTPADPYQAMVEAVDHLDKVIGFLRSTG